MSYYHVATFVKRVILDSESEQTKSEPMSLRQFVCQALDLRYEQSKVSQEIMVSDQNQMTTLNAASLLQPLSRVNQIEEHPETPLCERYEAKNYQEPINK